MAATATKKRRTPSAAQQAAAEERRARFRALAEKVAALSEEERAAIASRMGVVTIEGRALSANNVALVSMQHPTATVVGGYRQWLANGRQVRKGEHGLMIWVPTKRKVEGDDAEGSEERVGFIAGTVFDVSQTDPIE